MAIHEPEMLKMIKGLDLSDTEIEDEEVEGFAFLKELEYLNISNCTLSDGIKLLGRAVPKLKKLDISRTEIGDAVFGMLIQKLPNLEELDVCSCYWITDKCLDIIANKCPNLQILKVADTYLSKKGVNKLVDSRAGKLKAVWVDNRKKD